MKVLLKKYESINMDEIIIENGQEIKKSMPYLKLSLYVKPELFPDVTGNVGAMLDLHRPEEYIGEAEYSIPKVFIEGLRLVATMILDLIKSAERGKE